MPGISCYSSSLSDASRAARRRSRKDCNSPCIWARIPIPPVAAIGEVGVCGGGTAIPGVVAAESGLGGGAIP